MMCKLDEKFFFMAKPDIDVNVESYKRIRQQTVSICRPLETEDYVVQPIPEVSPPKWHLAHTSWFYEKFILREFFSGYSTYDAGFDKLFNSYYKSCGNHWLQSQRGILSRPTVKDILQYRAHIDEHMQELLNAPHTSANKIIELTQVGLHHEQQHQELLFMDIKYILATNPSLPTYEDRVITAEDPETITWQDLKQGLYEIGADSSTFKFDNETPRHKHYQPSCSVANRLITNGDYLEFMGDKGYENPLLWLSDGWNWLQQQPRSAPLYWNTQKNEWYEFTLHGNVPLNRSLPVAHISYYEANAFATWYGARLPTEEELELYFAMGATKTPSPQVYFHPSHTATNKQQLWLWTQSPYTPYPGYQAFTGALGEYNGKFMCNQQVLRGGCMVTPNGHYRTTYRNFYFPHQNWMFSGICLAKER